MTPPSYPKHLLRTLLIVFFSAFSLNALAQPWNWAVDAGGTGNVDANKSIATDTDSNVYCVGTFGGNNVVFGNQTNPSTNNHIWGFVAKYDRFGNFIWVRIVSHSTNDVSVDRIAISEQNEICIIGTAKQGTIGFGNGVTLVSSNPSTNVYLARFDVNGNAQWARTLTTSGSSLCAPGGLGFDANDNIYFSGTFTSSSSTPVSINGVTYAQNGASIFVIKYDLAGNIAWFRNTLTTGTGTRKAYGLSIVNGQLYTCGMVGVSTTFGTVGIGNIPGQSCYIARYDLAGNVQWVTEYGGPCDTHLLDVSADEHNNVFAVGRHEGTVYVDGDTLVASGSEEDAVILCLDTLGNNKWSALVGSTQADWARAVDADGLGNAYVGGHVRGTLDFMGTPVTTGFSQSEVFVAKVAGAGPLKWVKLGGGSANDYALAVHHEKGTNRVYAGGYYWLTATYGSSTINDVGNGDMMLAQLADTTFDVSWDVTGSCTNSCNGSIAVFTNGTPVLYEWSTLPGSSDHQENLCAGLYELTVTNSDGRTKTVQIEVPLIAPAPVVFDPVAAVCSDAPAFTLSQATPTGGTYTVDGVATNIFDPSALGAGVHEVGYVFGNASGCYDTTIREIVINALPLLAVSPIASVCADHGPVALENATPSGGSYSGNAVTAGAFAPSLAGAGDHTILYTYTDMNGCVNTITQVITVHALPVVSYQEVNAVCVDFPAFGLAQATPAGGTYAGNGVTGQQFDPAGAGAGNHVITYAYTDANGCSAGISETVTVHALPVLSYTGPTERCASDPAFVLAAAPTGGSYSGNGVAGTTFDPALAGPGVHTVLYSYTNAGGCSGELTLTITVHALPAVSYQEVNAVCADLPAFGLAQATPAGGTYAGNGVTGQQFDPAAAGAGDHGITYTYTDANGCSAGITETITVHALPVLSYPGPTEVCIDAPALELTATPGGGNYSGNGVVGTTFDPALAGPGAHAVLYSYTNGDGCSNELTTTITVHALPAVALLIQPDAICGNAPAFNLAGGSPAGGSYAINGTNTNVLDPGQTGPGEHVVSYTVTDQNGCTGSSEQTVTVLALPQVSYDEAIQAVCTYDGPVTLNAGVPAGGTFTGNGVGNGMFDPSGLSAGWQVITYSYTDLSGCSGQAQDSIFVDECLGLNSLLAGEINIGPNPAYDDVTITTGKDIATRITLLDAKGSVVMTLHPHDNTTVADVSQLAPGMYTFRIEVSGQVNSYRIVKR